MFWFERFPDSLYLDFFFRPDKFHSLPWMAYRHHYSESHDFDIFYKRFCRSSPPRLCLWYSRNNVAYNQQQEWKWLSKLYQRDCELFPINGFYLQYIQNLEKHPFDTKFPIFIKQESLAHIVRIPRSMLVGNFVASLYNGLVQMGFASGWNSLL